MPPAMKVLVYFALVPFVVLGFLVLVAIGGPIPVIAGIIGGAIVLIVKGIRKAGKKEAEQ